MAIYGINILKINSQSLTYTLSSGFSNSSNNRTKILKTANQIVIHLGVTYNADITARTDIEVLTITDPTYKQKNFDIFGVAVSADCAWLMMLKDNKLYINKYVGTKYFANNGIFGQIALFNNV